MRAGLTAEVIGLPSNIFRHCYSPWNKYQANGILNHLILAGGKTLWLPLAFEPSKGSPKKEVQHDKQPKNENNSIHGGTLFLMPQSYGTGLPVSRTPLSYHCYTIRISSILQDQKAYRHMSKRAIYSGGPVLQVDMLPFSIMIQCRHDNLR